jgi:hypothetical protein
MYHFQVKLRISEYEGNAMTADTAKFIRIETVRRSKLRYGEDYAIEKTLAQFKIDRAEYERIRKTSHFYFGSDGMIVIPDRQIKGMLKETVQHTKQKRVQPEWINKVRRLEITPVDIPTGRKDPDGFFGRPVLLKASTRNGQENGRWDYTETPVLKDIVIMFTVESHYLKDDELKQLLEEGSRLSGIGGARKIGKGQFQVEEFSSIADENVVQCSKVLSG